MGVSGRVGGAAGQRPLAVSRPDASSRASLRTFVQEHGGTVDAPNVHVRPNSAGWSAGFDDMSSVGDCETLAAIAAYVSGDDAPGGPSGKTARAQTSQRRGRKHGARNQRAASARLSRGGSVVTAGHGHREEGRQAAAATPHTHKRGARPKSPPVIDPASSHDHMRRPVTR
eukprot:SAG25_NODE_441_length_7974_cov_4.647873_7_plen_171_part_00